MKIFEIITEAPRRNDELIQKVKDLWDSGMTSTGQIAAELGITSAVVSQILFKYYSDRSGKEEHKKYSPELIQQVKDLWDSGVNSYADIENKLGIPKQQIANILWKYYPSRSNKKEKYSPELIQQVKDLWDSGITSASQIASKLKINRPKVAEILKLYYSDRSNKQEHFSPELIQQVKDLWDSGITYQSEIASKLGITKNQARSILDRYYTNRPNKQEHGEVPRALMPSIVNMYKNGQSPSTILKLLNINASESGVRHVLKQLPNWEEIRAEHLANKPTRKQNVATTDIDRPGTIGNKRSKGPSSRHTAGVDWPKYG